MEEMTDEQSRGDPDEDAVAAASLRDMRLTETQRKILRVLCRPRSGGNRYATPATNQEIAAEVYLSVDAVKAHLRALYRKFGVESLPQNQKRARLVELVLEGGCDLETGLDVVDPESTRSADFAPRPEVPVSGSPARRPTARRTVLIGTAIAIVLVGIAVAVSASLFGNSDGNSQSGTVVTKAEYVTAVNGYCRLAIKSLSPSGNAGTAERAASYLSVIETMRGRLASLATPSGGGVGRGRFSDGLEKAADFTGLVAQGTSASDAGASANIVAELTFAAGQVQAGAVGYGLGPECTEIGDVVARSAQNAAQSLR